MTDVEKKIKAFDIVAKIVEDESRDKEEKDAYLTLLASINDDGNDGTCNNHIADSWGACENCGRLVF